MRTGTTRVRELTVKYKTPPKPSDCRQITEPAAILEELIELRSEAREFFVVLHLDQKNSLVGREIVSIGSASASIVHPRETYKGAILSNSAGIIAVHNHPSGSLEPSREDMDCAKRLKASGDILGIKLVDFCIIGDGIYSFQSQGLLG